MIIGLTLDYFVRVDGRPVLASVALVTFAASNIALDWLLIVHWGWGIKGAAWATALAEGVIPIIGMAVGEREIARPSFEVREHPVAAFRFQDRTG